MQISLVEHEYRRRGVYLKMLELMLEKTRKYDVIHSCHHIFNNNIISIKLRKKFYITGFDNSVFVGPRVYLSYYNNKKMFACMQFRTGLIDKPSFD